MAHSNQIREFRLSDKGIELLDVYLGPGGVLTGSARAALEAQERAAAQESKNLNDGRIREREYKREALEARIAALRAEFEAESQEMKRLIAEDSQKQTAKIKRRADMARLRRADNQANVETLKKANTRRKK